MVVPVIKIEALYLEVNGPERSLRSQYIYIYYDYS